MSLFVFKTSSIRDINCELFVVRHHCCDLKKTVLFCGLFSVINVLIGISVTLGVPRQPVSKIGKITKKV